MGGELGPVRLGLVRQITPQSRILDVAVGQPLLQAGNPLAQNPLDLPIPIRVRLG